MILITNMPFLGPHFQISPNVSFRDGRLDVFTFSDMSKLDMLAYVLRPDGGTLEDAGIHHCRARHVAVVSKPRMPVLADGVPLGQGSLSVHIHPRALPVMAGTKLTGNLATTGLNNPKSNPDE
jgi:diacylglycerol kinase family enzyme